MTFSDAGEAGEGGVVIDHMTPEEEAAHRLQVEMAEDAVRWNARREMCEKSHLYFTRFFFRVRQGSSLIVNWHHHLMAEALDDVIFGRCENLLLNVPPGSTKCIDPEARVFTSKGLVPAKDIAFGDMIFSHDNGRLVLEKCLGTEPAFKRSLRLTMRSGRSLIMSHDHPMLSLSGYKKCEDFKVGDRIRCLAAEWDGKATEDLDELAFVAYMIFEGNCTSATIRWSGQENSATSDFLAVCGRLGIEVKKYASSHAYDFNIMGGASGRAAQILKRHGVWMCSALKKRLPPSWAALPLYCKYRILGIMFATDGFYAKNTGSLCITLANQPLIQDIQHFLSTCGVVSSYHSHTNGHAGYTRLKIPREHTEKLLPKIDIFHKQKKVDETAKKKHQSYLLAYPSEILKGVKGFWYWSKFNGKPGGKKTLTQATFDKCAKKFPVLEKYRNIDFYWDEVTDIASVGKRELIHLQIARTKNFVVEGLVSHNTEMAVISLMARGIALNPYAKFLHLSSGDDLVLLNSQTSRDIVESDEYQRMWPRKISSDASAKRRWNVDVNENGKETTAGGVYAVALGGQITGFRAGRMMPGFQGAIIIDDPLKSDDAFSDAKVRLANRRLISTVNSRRANPKTPIIMIMQRVGQNDPSAFVKGGNLPGKWRCVSIPALIDDAYIATLPERIRKIAERDTANNARDENGRFSYWEYKEPLQQLVDMEKGVGADTDGNRISRFVFASQYQQEPASLGGNIIHDKFLRVAVFPKIKYRMIYADTAQKTAERNDYSVFQCWGLGEDMKAYFIDQIRGKWEAPELKRKAREFWAKHKDAARFPHAVYGGLRKMMVEDKASGTGLIQEMKRPEAGQAGIPVEGIQRDRDKLTRVMDVVSYIEAGFVCVPEGAPWLLDFIAECEAFTADDTHAHDDQIDPLCDALSDLLGPKPQSFFF